MIAIPGIKEPHSSTIQNLFKDLPAGSVILFGSRAKGNFREGSDIDIALKGCSSNTYSQIVSAYEDLFLPWKLDLLAYETIREPELKSHIDRVGIILR